MRVFALALLLSMLATASAAQRSDEELLDAAISSYTEALNTEDRDLRLETFRRSERLFAAAVARGIRNPDLFANLGNAALQADRLGNAVLAYRRVLLLDPDHARALQNLDHARSQLPEWVPRPATGTFLDTFFFWHRTLSRAERALGAAACFAAAAFLLALAIRTGQAALRNLSGVPALAFAALLGSLWLDPATQNRQQAVITADETLARAADSPLAPAIFPAPLPGGTEVRIVERRSPWLRARLANGRDAWIAESSATLVAITHPPRQADGERRTQSAPHR